MCSNGIPETKCNFRTLLIEPALPAKREEFPASSLLVPTLSLCIRSDLPLVTSFYALTYALTPLPYCNYVLCTMWFCLHVLQLLYVVPLVSGKATLWRNTRRFLPYGANHIIGSRANRAHHDMSYQKSSSTSHYAILVTLVCRCSLQSGKVLACADQKRSRGSSRTCS